MTGFNEWMTNQEVPSTEGGVYVLARKAYEAGEAAAKAEVEVSEMVLVDPEAPPLMEAVQMMTADDFAQNWNRMTPAQRTSYFKRLVTDARIGSHIRSIVDRETRFLL